MRRLAGIALMVAALGCLLSGAAMAILLGPDNRALTGPHPMSVDEVALVTAPDVLSWAGPTVTVLAELPDERPVFIGLGNAVDVTDYLRDTRVRRVESYEVPWTVTTSEVDGQDFVPAAPLALDWWLAQSAGKGGASLSFRLPDETVSLAVIAVGDTTLEGLRVTASYDVAGGFGIGLGLVGLGLGLAVFGWIAFRRPEPDEVDWVDEDEEAERAGEDADPVSAPVPTPERTGS